MKYLKKSNLSVGKYFETIDKLLDSDELKSDEVKADEIKAFKDNIYWHTDKKAIRNYKIRMNKAKSLDQLFDVIDPPDMLEYWDLLTEVYRTYIDEFKGYMNQYDGAVDSDYLRYMLEFPLMKDAMRDQTYEYVEDLFNYDIGSSNSTAIKTRIIEEVLSTFDDNGDVEDSINDDFELDYVIPDWVEATVPVLQKWIKKDTAYASKILKRSYNQKHLYKRFLERLNIDKETKRSNDSGMWGLKTEAYEPVKYEDRIIERIQNEFNKMYSESLSAWLGGNATHHLLYKQKPLFKQIFTLGFIDRKAKPFLNLSEIFQRTLWSDMLTNIENLKDEELYQEITRITVNDEELVRSLCNKAMNQIFEKAKKEIIEYYKDNIDSYDENLYKELGTSTDFIPDWIKRGNKTGLLSLKESMRLDNIGSREAVTKKFFTTVTYEEFLSMVINLVKKHCTYKIGTYDYVIHDATMDSELFKISRRANYVQISLKYVYWYVGRNMEGFAKDLKSYIINELCPVMTYYSNLSTARKYTEFVNRTFDIMGELYEYEAEIKKCEMSDIDLAHAIIENDDKVPQWALRANNSGLFSLKNAQ